MLLPKGVYEEAGFHAEEPLLQMSDFNGLIARSQEHQVPIFELTDDQLKLGGGVLENTKESMARFRGLFDQAADRVISLISHAADA